MARDEAYRKAEEKIEQARRIGATELDLSCPYDAEDSEKLTELPEPLGQLTQLQSLDLSRNKMTALPDSLGQLTQLQSLNLSANELTALPEWLGQLTQLQTLDLHHNQLTALPESLGHLTQLQSLDVFGNELTALPDAFSSLRALVNLRLGVYGAGNPLGEVPAVLRSLNRLTVLTVSECQLKSLPEWMGELTQLSAFHATGNVLTTLPVSFGHFGDLQEFGLADNPLNPELAAAYEQGLDAVKAYLRAKAEGTVVLNEAKLILIGEGEVGKTCLLDALRGEPWQEHETTHGVEINPVVLTPPKGAKLTLNGWDFGGQEVYRPTHQLFFTAPAVYLVVWKPREGVQQGAVEYWIETIKSRAGPEAKILVVATHGGPQRRQPDIEEEHLRGKYGKDTILGFLHVDSKPNKKGTRTGITKLKNAIARVAAGLPNVGREVPASWSHVLTAVRERSSTDPYITYKQFQSLCRPRKVNHALAATYAGMLNEMGHAIHYTDDDELGKYMILKPDWLAKAISFVLDDKTTRDRHGLVDHDYLSKLWSNPPYKDVTGYAKKLHPLFRGLMERFDLTYEVVIDPAAENGSGASLIAQLVPGKPPKRLPDWGAKPHAGDREQIQLCRIVDIERAESSNAEGLFYRLIVRLHKYSLGRENYKKSVHWQRGLMLDDGYNGRALIERVGNDVRITVRAAYPGFFLFELTKEVKWLVDHPKQGWPGLRCDVMVPCIEPCGLNKAGYGLFEVEKLIINTQKEIAEVLCTAHGCSQVHRVAELMTNAPGARRTRLDSLGEKVEDVHDELRAIRKELQTRTRKGDWQFARLHENQRRLLSQTDEQFEALMQTLTDEARNGPRLFSFVPVNRNFFNLKKWTTEKFRLTLWCEYSRLPLPSKQLNGETSKRGVYVVEFPREWLVKAAPLLKFMGTTLGMVLPVVSPAAKVLTDDATYKRFGEELELGIKCAQSVLKGAGEAGGWLARSDDADFEPGDPMRAQDDVLREFHSILKKKDPGFGGLVRVQNKRHEFLWVHKKFAGEY